MSRSSDFIFGNSVYLKDPTVHIDGHIQLGEEINAVK